MTSLLEYYRMLEQHDWYFERADDRSVRLAGDQNLDRLLAIGKESTEHAELYADWHRHMFYGEPKPPLPKTEGKMNDDIQDFEVSLDGELDDAPVTGNQLARPAASVPVTQPMGVSPMVQLLIDKKLDTQTMKEMLEIQKDYEANEARKAYHAAVAEFKKTAPTITKNKLVEFDTRDGDKTSYRHTTLGYALTQINPELSRYGLSLSWKTEQKDGSVHVTCTLTHALGYSESTSLFASPDSSGKKNPIQQIASTVTYLKRHTAFALLGLESIEDDDGASSDTRDEPQDNSPTITDSQLSQLVAMLDENNMNHTKFIDSWMKPTLKVSRFEDLTDAGFQQAMKKIEGYIKNRRKK